MLYFIALGRQATTTGMRGEVATSVAFLPPEWRAFNVRASGWDMIASFRSKVLHRFWRTEIAVAFVPIWSNEFWTASPCCVRPKIDIDVPGARFHSLRGIPKRYAVDVDLEDYH